MAESNNRQEGMEAIAKLAVKMGIDFDKDSIKDIEKNLTPIQQFMKKFGEQSGYKDSIFSKFPSISKALNALIPDTLRAAKATMIMGAASKDGADKGQKFYRSMGFMGKGLSSVISFLGKIGPATGAAGKAWQMFMTTITFGLAAVVAIIVEIGQLFVNGLKSAIEFSQKLNEYNRLMGGVGIDTLTKFGRALNKNFEALQNYGFALGEIFDTVSEYMKTGIKQSIALDTELIRSTNLIAVATGESASSIAGFFSGIFRGSNMAKGALEDIGNTFTNFNRFVAQSGLAGQIGWDKFKEAIESAQTALLVMANRHSPAAMHRMMGDLMSLTSLAQTLNISIGELNSKFEESSNLIGSPNSPFRAILAVSGGANFNQMLTNQFNRTDAMLRVAETLRQLNVQFGGNLNILGQIGERSFGLSREMTIKLATLSEENRKAMRQIQEDSNKMHKDSLDKTYGSLMNTLGNAWERFKNIFSTMLQRTFAGNEALQHFLNRVSEISNNLITQFTNPNSTFSKIFKFFGDVVTWISEKLEKLFTNVAGPWLSELLNDFNGIFETFKNQGFWMGVIKMITFPLVELAKLFARTVVFILHEALGKSTIGKLFFNHSEGYDWSDPAKQRGILQTFSTQSQEVTDRLGKISSELAKVRDEKAQYSGMKDTDIVVDKHGKLTLAGLQKYELQNKEDSLTAAQNALTSSTDKLQSTMEQTNELMRDYLKAGIRQQEGYRDAGVTKAPKPFSISPIVKEQQQYESGMALAKIRMGN